MLFGANIFAANTTATITTPVANPQPAAEPQPVMTEPAAESQPQPRTQTISVSSNGTTITITPDTASQPEPEPVATSADGTAAPTEAVATPAVPLPQAQTKTEPAAAKQKYVAPASPQEAHDRIEEAATAVPAKVTKQQVGDLYIFGGKTFALRQAFTMLGGTFDQTTQSWSLSVERYDNPALCQDTFDAEVERSRKAADATAKREADIQKRIDEAVATARKQWETEHKTTTPATTTAGMITIADAQAATKKALSMMLAALSKTPDQTLDAIIKKAYSA